MKSREPARCCRNGSKAKGKLINMLLVDWLDLCKFFILWIGRRKFSIYDFKLINYKSTIILTMVAIGSAATQQLCTHQHSIDLIILWSGL